MKINKRIHEDVLIDDKDIFSFFGLDYKDYIGTDYDYNSIYCFRRFLIKTDTYLICG